MRIIYSDKASSFEGWKRMFLLEKDYSVSIHNGSIQLLAIEMCKASKGLSPPIITQLFKRKTMNTNIIWDIMLNLPYLLWIWYIMGLNSTSFLGLKIWDVLPDRPKKIDSLRTFKMAFRSLKPEKCACSLQDINSQCWFYLRKPGSFQIGRGLNSSISFFIFCPKKPCRNSNYYNYMYNCDL